jgi:hypothetical protein
LIDEIGRWERDRGPAAAEEYEYYDRWAAALERLVVETGMVSPAELAHEVEHVLANDTHDH